MDELGKVMSLFNPLSAKATKWSNTLKQFHGKLPTNCVSVFDHFVGLVLKGLNDGLFQRLFVSGNGDSAKVSGFTPPIGILQNVF